VGKGGRIGARLKDENSTKITARSSPKSELKFKIQNLDVNSSSSSSSCAYFNGVDI